MLRAKIDYNLLIMPADISSETRTANWKSFLPIAGLLALILCLLFYKSFIPEEVVFSNDGPLGTLVEQQNQLPQLFTGAWYNLNSIGSGGGMVPPCISSLLRTITGPVGYAKFFPLCALFILGIGAWTFFRQLKLTPLAAVLGALAAMLTSTFFSDACWGVASHEIAAGMDFFALALIVSNSPTTSWYLRWTRLALAGMAVGLNVMEAFDIGAIFSIFIAIFALFQALVEEGQASAVMQRIVCGIGRIAVIALFAGFIATQVVVSLVSTQIEGIVGTGQTEADKAAHWDYATQWSLPKSETLGIIVPGLFGYRMDTPEGGAYWGGIGRDPAWDRYIAQGKEGPAPQGFFRFSGGGNYAGTLVLLVALWAFAQSIRRQNSIFSKMHRQFVWFWTGVMVVALLFSYGRFAPFYHLFYSLPYFSTIRNPIKFLYVFSWALVIVFAYGIHGLSRRYLEAQAPGSSSPPTRFRAWWKKARGFDRNWISICIVVFIGSLLAWLIYALQKPDLIAYLQTVGFPDQNMAGQIAGFSIRQIGWFVLFFALDAILIALILSGGFAGRRAKWAGILLGLLLLGDLGRADLPWIVYWNYPEKYASNPVVDILEKKPYEHRVAYGLPRPIPTPQQFDLFKGLYDIEWTQQLFPYYNIQSLDVVQMPRLPADLAAYQSTFQIGVKQNGSGQWMLDPTTFPLVGRLWQLTNTRYLLGPAALLDLLNQQFDPAHHRFSLVQAFNVVPKPGIANPTQYSQMTAVPAENGDYALIEFTGALPRARLYSQWQVSTNDNTTLQTLASTNFDAWKTVLVSTPLSMSPKAASTNTPGAVEFKSYAPKDIVLTAQAAAPSVLLLNDKYDPDWRVTVDGAPEPLLRCNFIMRGVYLAPGQHTVEFKFVLPHGPLYVTVSAIGVGILLCGFLFFSARPRHPSV